MNCTHRTLILPLLGALIASSACREGGPIDSAPTAGNAATAGTGGGAAPSSAVAMIAALPGSTVTGTATFTKGTGTDVIVNVQLTGCTAGKAYAVHIHTGTTCADAMGHWGPARGEGIPPVMCVGTTGMSMLTRAATDPMTAWTIGGDPATNVVGHAFVMHNPDVPTMPPAIGCGVITAK
ncbi:MAG TPA: superoxide dismutase family protein [Polyangiales bacterium]|nr:superoxide dismutase family protein [Polyangiales bacterium]